MVLASRAGAGMMRGILGRGFRGRLSLGSGGRGREGLVVDG